MLGKLNESIESFDRAIGINPELASAWSNNGNFLMDLGRYNESIECYDRVIELDPLDTNAGAIED